jgi:hypothetical protein
MGRRERHAARNTGRSSFGATPRAHHGEPRNE